jgi:hypothetical protein
MTNPVSYRRIHASCHCGNIRVEFDRPDSGPAIPVRACSCGLCTKHRAAWTSHPNGRFHLRIAEESRVTQYRFGTKTADFHVCLTCGAIPIVTCMIEGIRYAVFNVNTFDDVDRSELVETATNFDGETTESRLAGGGATGRQRQSAARGKTDCETSGWVIRVDLVSGVSPLIPRNWTSWTHRSSDAKCQQSTSTTSPHVTT